MEQRQFRRIGFIAGKVLVEIIRGVVLQNPAGFTHDFHRGKIAFQCLDRTEMEPLRMPGLIQITVEPGINVNAFRTAVIDRENTIKLIIGNRQFIFLLKFTCGNLSGKHVQEGNREKSQRQRLSTRKAGIFPDTKCHESPNGNREPVPHTR